MLLNAQVSRPDSVRHGTLCCWACRARLSSGQAVVRFGFCRECWERSRLAFADEELGGEG